MSASSIAIYLDIFKDSLSHELPGGEAFTVNGFNFQRPCIATLITSSSARLLVNVLLQYFGRFVARISSQALGSVPRITGNPAATHAAIPPAIERTSVKPICCRTSAPRALRAPLAQ